MTNFICQSRLAREHEINQTSYENNLSNVLLKKQGLRSQISEIEYLLRLLNQQIVGQEVTGLKCKAIATKEAIILKAQGE